MINNRVEYQQILDFLDESFSLQYNQHVDELLTFLNEFTQASIKDLSQVPLQSGILYL